MTFNFFKTESNAKSLTRQTLTKSLVQVLKVSRMICFEQMESKNRAKNSQNKIVVYLNK